MSTKTEIFVKQLKGKIKEWDADFDRLQIKEYPLRLLAQVKYRERVEALIATRLLVEEKLINFDKRVRVVPMKVKAPMEWVGGLYMNLSDKPQTGLVRHLADFLNKKYAKQWRIDMPKGKYKKIHPEGFATQEQREVAAYYQWQNRGCPSNDSLTDWVNACEELTRQP